MSKDNIYIKKNNKYNLITTHFYMFSSVWHCINVSQRMIHLYSFCISKGENIGQLSTIEFEQLKWDIGVFHKKTISIDTCPYS